jgi:uncharacterized protein YbjT (DUF2867 family)
VARVLIVGGGCRGRRLAAGLIADGHAVRITTRAERGRAAIEQAGAECWVGTPDRLATLRGALDGVTVLCWLLGGAGGSSEELTALYTTRLEFFLTQAIDTTVRGFVYEAAGAGPPPELLAGGEEIVARLTARNEIPVSFLRTDPAEGEAWLAEARGTIDSLLGLS